MKYYLRTDIFLASDYRLFTEKGLIAYVNEEIKLNDSSETILISDIHEAIDYVCNVMSYGIEELELED